MIVIDTAERPHRRRASLLLNEEDELAVRLNSLEAWMLLKNSPFQQAKVCVKRLSPNRYLLVLEWTEAAPRAEAPRAIGWLRHEFLLPLRNSQKKTVRVLREAA